MQVVKELKRTAYKPRTAILAAKRHYCVHDDVTAAPQGVEEACEKLLDSANGCIYMDGVAKFLPHALTSEQLRVCN
jgi:hypothetical protein